MPEVSVIICTYNRCDFLNKTLNKLNNQSYDLSKLEVLVIDNNSPDNTRHTVDTFIKSNTALPVRYILEKQQGLSFARNRGIIESRSEIAVFIDDDAYACTEFIKEIKSHFDNYPNTVAIGGKIVPLYESQEPIWMSKFLLTLVAAIDLGNKNTSFKGTKFPIGANMAFRKSVFEQVGKFNTNLGRKGNSLEGSEEKDLFLRIKKINKDIIFLPRAEVEHFIPDKRVQIDYIKKQSEGIGKSEYIRNQKLGQTIPLLIRETFKWAGTLVLFFLYLVRFEHSKGTMLVRFRYWVSSGIFKKI